MLGADVVNIVEEKKPDFLNSCYRVKAEFLKFNDAEFISSLQSDIYLIPKRELTTNVAMFGFIILLLFWF